MNEELFPIRLKELRESHRFTLEDVANKSGTTKQTISRYEKGERSPKLEILYKLSTLFKVDMNWLAGGEENTSTIETIYNQLDEPRQEKVYSFAEEQLNEQQNAKVVPIVGTTAANPEVVTYGDAVHGEYCEAPNNADYAIVVKGDSMEPDYADGSTVYYIKQEVVENGELAIVEIDGEGVTFKKVIFDYDNEKIILKSLNEDYSDRVLDSNRVQIVGKVTK